MSILSERDRSVNINELQNSSLNQRLYMNNAYLSTKQAISYDISDSNLVNRSHTENSIDMTTQINPNLNYLREFKSTLQERDRCNLPITDNVKLFSQHQSGKPLEDLTRTNYAMNSLQPIHVRQTNSGFEFYDLIPSQIQNASTNITPYMPYYNNTDYNKISYPNNFQPGPLNCNSEFPNLNLNASEYHTGNLKAPPTTQIIQPLDASHTHNYNSGVENYKSGYNFPGADLRSKCIDNNNRNGRHPCSMFQSSQDESTLSSMQNRNMNAVELLVSNLDYNIGAKEWRKILITQLQPLIKNVHSIAIQTQADGSNCAVVKVGSIEDARLAISHFHRKKIGYKRIQVNIMTPNNNFGTKGLKIEVVSLLRSVSGNTLPVCKFIDLFEKRFHRTISVSDLYKMRDIIEIKEQPGNQGGRIVVLTNRAQKFDTGETTPSVDPVVCRIHCLENSPEYIRAMDSSMLPCVTISLNLFRQQLLKLLQNHGGSMPLMSLPACYKAEFGDLIIVPNPTIQTVQTTNATSSNQNTTQNSKDESRNEENVEASNSSQSEQKKKDSNTESQSDGGSLEASATDTTQTNSNGVPLEHLITCVPSVHISIEPNGVRKIIYDPNRETGVDQSTILNNLGGQLRSVPNAPLSPSICSGTQSTNASITHSNMGGHFQSTPGALLDQLHQFSREVVDLIKHQPGCQILLSKFIPSYHHHFGKQCRVADYGYSKLHELIDALPNVVHVMGSGHLRLLTLSHRVQVRRFTNELIKVLKSQSTKSCRLGDYATIYRRIYRKEFRITDYGVCFLADMLSELSDNAVEISGSGHDAIIALPKRVQTAEERERTELFAIEVADLLCQSPRCRLPFNKFIPSYHHHFSRQCRVADYGFTKLVDLLEAVPNVVKIVEEQGEKYVTLIRQKHLQIVAEQLLTMLEAAPGKRIPLDSLINVYMKHQGYALCLEDFGMTSVRELLSKLPRLVRIETICSPDEKHLLTSNLQLEKDSHTKAPDESTEVEDLKPCSDGDEVKSSTSTLPNGDKVTECSMIDYVCLADRTQIKHLAHKVLLVLLETPTGALSVPAFSERFRCTFRDEPNLKLIYEELGNIVEFKENRQVSDVNQGFQYCSWEEQNHKDTSYNTDCFLERTKLLDQKDEFHIVDTQHKVKSALNEDESSSKSLNYYSNLESVNAWIALRPLIMFARELRELLRQNQGKILLVQLCAMYQRRFGIPLKPQRYNYPSLATLLQAVDFVALMRGRGVRCTLLLCQDFLGKLSYRVAYNTKPVIDDQIESPSSISTDNKANILDQTPISLNRASESTVNSTPTVLWSHSENITKLIPSPVYNTTQNTIHQPLTSNHQINSICSSFNPSFSDSSIASNAGFLTNPTYRTYPLTYAQYPTNNAGQINTYGAPPQLASATYSYYPVPPTQNNSLGHQVLTRPGYISSMMPESHSTFTILQNNAGYGCTNSPYSSDCHLSTPGAFGQIAFPAQPSNFTPVTVITNGNSVSNTNIVGPGGEHPNGNLAFPSSVLSTSSMYPFNLGLAFTNPVHPINCSSHNNNLLEQRIDIQNTINAESSSSLGCTSKKFENGYTSQTKSHSSIQPTNNPSSRSFGASSAAQQQLDELVERLAYDNAINGSGTENRSLENDRDKSPCDATSIADLCRSDRFSNQPLSHVSRNMPNNLNGVGNIDPLNRNPYPQTLFSAYCAAQNPSIFHMNTFSNPTLYSSSIYDSTLSQRLCSSNPINFNQSFLQNATLNYDASLINTSNDITCEGKKLENMSEDCPNARNLMMGITPNIEVINSDRASNVAMNTLGNGNINSLQSVLPDETSAYSFDQCQNKQVIFGNYDKEPIVHFNEESMSTFIKHNQESFISTLSSKNEHDYMNNINSISPTNTDNKHVNINCLGCSDQADLGVESKLREDNTNVNRSIQSTQVPPSQSDPANTFNLDGFMADLRHDSEQRQQKISLDHEKEQQQNTGMLLSSFNYL